MKSRIISILIFIVIIAASFGVYYFVKPYVPLEIISAISEEEKIKPDQLVSISPKKIYPGDPLMITVSTTTSVREVLFDKKKISVMDYNGKPRAFVAIDFNEKVLEHEVRVNFVNNISTTTFVVITPRQKIDKPLGIPEKLGGNTPEAGKTLVSNLSKENSHLATAQTAPSQLWSKSFIPPLNSIFVTDDYGYNRDTAGQNIVHKGTDFRAATGTEVMAVNDGIVRISQKYTVYGNTIVLDHGLGLASLYMHLSELKVKVGDKVERGQVIALSGDTGYAEAPHLHVSFRIKGVSIDPMTFLNFFK